MNPVVLGFGILVCTVLAAFGAGWAVGLRLRERCNVGEALVAVEIAARFRRPHLLINNVTLPTGAGSTQIDHILVADTGIFVIETKHYQGWIFGSAEAKDWTQVIYRCKWRFQNPLRQNYAHLEALKALFTLPAEAYSGVVVFTGTAEFKMSPVAGVVKLTELVAHLSKDRPAILDERKMAYIVGRIEMKRLRRCVETDEYHLNALQRRFERRSAGSRAQKSTA